jgi:glycosyltransferase involved in cell wall biosynthesis
MISLICSNYNSAKFIDRYLGYVNHQFLESFEIIFVDANSTDGSLQTIENYNFREGIEKTIIKCEKRITIYEAWNKGIEAAKYDWVMNYNTDDKIFPSSLLTLGIYANSVPDIDVFYSNCWITTKEDHSNIVDYYNWNPASSLELLLRDGSCVGPFPLLKKETIIKEGGFNTDYTICSDFDMWCKLSSKGYKFLKIHELVGSYYKNPEGMSTKLSNRSEVIREDTKIRQTYTPFLYGAANG